MGERFTEWNRGDRDTSRERVRRATVQGAGATVREEDEVAARRRTGRTRVRESASVRRGCSAEVRAVGRRGRDKSRASGEQGAEFEDERRREVLLF